MEPSLRHPYYGPVAVSVICLHMLRSSAKNREAKKAKQICSLIAPIQSSFRVQKVRGQGHQGKYIQKMRHIWSLVQSSEVPLFCLRYYNL